MLYSRIKRIPFKQNLHFPKKESIQTKKKNEIFNIKPPRQKNELTEPNYRKPHNYLQNPECFEYSEGQLD